jgi:hypothetical protein
MVKGKHVSILLVVLMVVSWCGVPLVSGQADMNDQNHPLLLAHYMPWYQTPAGHGSWGWHWTMDHFNPAQTDANGRPEIASHFMPLTGPYDSSDEALLEYQVLLMKISGIDGVIVDWYGMENFRDYATLNESTGKLFAAVKKAGLVFVICYEDQSILHMVEDNHLTSDQALAHGQDVMRYMQEQWFSDDAYLKEAGQPVLFTFGPQYFKSSTQWDSLFAVVEPHPVLVTLDKHMVSGSLSSYPWPPMFGISINQKALEAYLTQFYRKASRWEYIVGGAFPGFYDIYQEAGVRNSYGYLDAQQGETFRYTLQLALDQNPDVVQLITWNDYGEGTNIEPTEEYGTQYLEIVQEARRTMDGSAFLFTAEDLQLPLRLFQLRQEHAGDARLDDAFNAIIAGDTATAAQILAEF